MAAIDENGPTERMIAILRSLGIHGRAEPGRVSLDDGTIYELRGAVWICSELPEHERDKTPEVCRGITMGKVADPTTKSFGLKIEPGKD